MEKKKYNQPEIKVHQTELNVLQIEATSQTTNVPADSKRGILYLDEDFE